MSRGEVRWKSSARRCVVFTFVVFRTDGDYIKNRKELKKGGSRDEKISIFGSGTYGGAPLSRWRFVYVSNFWNVRAGRLVC
jgi:hypothetical protein